MHGQNIGFPALAGQSWNPPLRHRSKADKAWGQNLPLPEMSKRRMFRRKYSSQIYVSLLPQTNSGLTITAATDKRAEYMEKSIAGNLFSFENFGFPWLTFDTNNTPRIQRVRLKVKKFVYYKLIFKVETPGARATILGYDQTVRFASMAK